MALTENQKDFPQLRSLDRISKIPVVETGVQCASVVYLKIKNSNPLMRWSFKSVEFGIQMALQKSLAAVPLLEMPLFIVDNIVCKSLDTVEQRVPAINYPPELLLNLTKDMVSARIVQPVIKRADSMKQFGVIEATKYGEIAVSRLDSALSVADEYVDKYLPDVTDNADSPAPAYDNKTVQTIEHVNRFSRKLQRRLTKRTIAEAKALKKQSADTAQMLLYLAEMMVKDPKQFATKMKAVWEHLSLDEPENQVPPANLEQLIEMLTRELARRVVHITNFTIATIIKLPTYTAQATHIANHAMLLFLDVAIKAIHTEGSKAIAATKTRAELKFQFLVSQIDKLLDLVQLFYENLASQETNKNSVFSQPASPSTPQPELQKTTEKNKCEKQNKINQAKNKKNSNEIENTSEKSNNENLNKVNGNTNVDAKN